MSADRPSLVRLTTVPHSAFAESWYELAQEDHFWMQRRMAFLKEAFQTVGLHAEKTLLALDIGSGNGVVRQQLERDTSWTVDCADISETALQKCPAGRGENLLYNILELHPSRVGRYDLVFLLDVAEHISDPKPFLDAAVRHLTPGGHLIINVPALPALFSRYDECAGHVRRYTRRSLRAELAGLPLESRFERYWGITLVPLLILRKLLLQSKKSRDDVIRLGFKPPSPLIDAALSSTLSLEQAVCHWRPLGSSLIYVGQRSD